MSALARRAARLAGAEPGELRQAPFEPQLATLGSAVPAGDEWVHELKWDGYRIIATVVAGEVRLWSRNAQPWTAKLPQIRRGIEKLGLRAAALDGELIAGRGTREDFGVLQATLAGSSHKGLSLVLFDLLHLDGISLERCSLLDRKSLLAQLLEDRPSCLGYSSHGVGDGPRAFALAAEHGYEGIVSKRASRPYVHGRSADWRKIKHVLSAEFAVVGYTPAKNSYGFGSLLLAKPDRHGWVYAGRVGSGFSDALMRSLLGMLSGGGSPTPSVRMSGDRRSLRDAVWFEPRFVVEVYCRGLGRSGVLRQPSFKAVRPDRDVHELQAGPRGDSGRRR